MSILKDFSSIVAVAVVLGTLGSTFPAKAITLSTSSGRIGTVNVTTGAFTPFISTGPIFTDIARSNNDDLFGITFSDLYSIGTSSSTLIGGLSVALMNGLAFDNSSTLYGTSISGNLYSVNITTGTATAVASIPGFSSAGDIVFDPAINAFLATSTTPTNSTLFKIATDGTASIIGNIGFADVWGLGFDEGTLYGYTAVGQQLIINPSTGLGQFDKNVTGFSLNEQIYGVASSINEAQAVPESSSVLGTLAFGVFGAGIVLKRKLKSSKFRLYRT